MAQLRVAILGGGVAGAVLIHALTQTQPHIDAHIFEAAASFHGSGLAISINEVAQQGIDLIGPSASQALASADARLHRGITWSIATGPDAGKLVDKTDSSHLVVQRSEFLRVFLKDVPEERMHPNKKLKSISQTGDGPVLLSFEDGTSHECDIFLGADGINSLTRRYILGDVPAASPVPTDWYNIWLMVPYDRAREILGADLVDESDPREHMWLGKDTFLIHNVSGGGLVQLAGVVRDPTKDREEWFKPLDLEKEKQRWSDWPPHLSQALLTFLSEEERKTGICFWEHPHAETYVKKNVAIIGDAAHSTTPWQGAGGSMGLEDASLLNSLLGKVKSRAEATIALQVYDASRRPRTQAIVDSCHAIGNLETGQSLPLTHAALKDNMAHRWNIVGKFDCEKSRDEALQSLQTRLAGSRS